MAQGIRDFVAAYERAFPGEVVRVTEPVSTRLRRHGARARVRAAAALSDPPLREGRAAPTSRSSPTWWRAAARWRSRSACPSRGLARGVRAAHQGHDQAGGRRRPAVPRSACCTGADLDLGAAADPDLLPGRRRPLPDRRHARRARSRDRRGDRGLSPLPGQGPRPHGREPALAPPHVRVPAPGRGARPGAAVRGRARPAPARVDGLARLPAAPTSASSRSWAGCFGEPLEVAPCTTIDLHVPAAAEIVIEGEILPGVREPEGPFGEFTGYFSRRSTEHVFVAKAIAMRERPVVPVDRLRPRGRPHHHARPRARGRDPQRARAA